jgi:hypothetical protein
MKISKPTLRMTILAASLASSALYPVQTLHPKTMSTSKAGARCARAITGTCVRTCFWAPGVNDANCGGQVEAGSPRLP